MDWSARISVAYGLSLCTDLDDLEWPWTP